MFDEFDCHEVTIIGEWINWWLKTLLEITKGQYDSL